MIHATQMDLERVENELVSFSHYKYLVCFIEDFLSIVYDRIVNQIQNSKHQCTFGSEHWVGHSSTENLRTEPQQSEDKYEIEKN